MTPRTRSTRKPVEQPQDQPQPLDAHAVAVAAVDEQIGTATIAARKRDLAITRHTAAVVAAGGPVPLDWYTRQLIDPVRGVAS